jgi:saxitoxin biosynthesis operon SxtJ-like protein
MAHVTTRERLPEREFGLIVGGIFALLSVWWFYRGKFHDIRLVTLSLGSVLVILGLLLPRALVWPNKAWMALAEVLSFVSMRVILALVFYVVITPIGCVKRICGWDPLRRRAPAAESYWRPYTERQHNPRHYEKMF